MTRNEFLYATLRKRAAWLRSITREAVFAKPTFGLVQFKLQLKDKTQHLQYEMLPGKVDNITWCSVQGKWYTANYATHYQVIVITCLLVLDMLLKEWPEGLEWLEEVLNYYLAAANFSGVEITQENGHCVLDWRENNLERK
jgi:hypothetical protein